VSSSTSNTDGAVTAVAALRGWSDAGPSCRVGPVGLLVRGNGTVMVKVLPRPGVLSRVMRPWWACTRSATTANPMPAPCSVLSVAR
jgi:hypothetical protein